MNERAVPAPVLRQWSDALAAAGLFTEAELIHPDAERSDVVRKAELAVLAGDHALALKLLAELTTARTARTARSKNLGKQAKSPAGSPWLALLTRCATVMSGEVTRMPTVLAAAQRVQPSAGVSWVVALAAATAGDLGTAAAAAAQAVAGGCRDLRILAILAAERSTEGDDAAALDLAGRAMHNALPDEDPTGFVVDLMERAGFRNNARRLAIAGAADGSQPARVRAAWSLSARRVGAGRGLVLRKSLTAAGSMAERHRQWQLRKLQDELVQDLTCRCYGSAGWVGQNRMHYVNNHLTEVLAVPVQGLAARLVRCRATNLTFLDFAERQLTLPVVSELIVDQRPGSANPRSGPGALRQDDPDGHPTPGMGVSLGIALGHPPQTLPRSWNSA